MATKTKPRVPAKKELSASERFAEAIIKEFSNISGNGMTFTPEQKILAQHLFISIDTALKKAEIDRIKNQEKNKPPIVWNNIDLPELAKNAVHRINLGLDAFIGNHIHIVPYFIKGSGKYNIDLHIGYVGKDFYRRNMAIEPPKDIRYELVYENDTFKPIKKDASHEIETYEFEIPQPFDRGKIIGGFGYIIYDDPSKNRLVIVTEEEFKKAEECAPSKVFWTKWPDRQRYKTIVLRATNTLSTDPSKINNSFMIVEEEDTAEKRILAEIEEKANKTEIEILPEPDPDNDDKGKKEDKSEKDEIIEDADFADGPGF